MKCNTNTEKNILIIKNMNKQSLNRKKKEDDEFSSIRNLSSRIFKHKKKLVVNKKEKKGKV